MEMGCVFRKIVYGRKNSSDRWLESASLFNCSYNLKRGLFWSEEITLEQRGRQEPP